MCGIVGAVAQRNVVPILIEGLRKLEYRGYDSAGLALLDPEGHMNRVRAVGRVAELDTRAKEKHADAPTGIAHTRWATHGGVNEGNAHPHISTGSELDADARGGRVGHEGGNRGGRDPARAWSYLPTTKEHQATPRRALVFEGSRYSTLK